MLPQLIQWSTNSFCKGVDYKTSRFCTYTVSAAGTGGGGALIKPLFTKIYGRRDWLDWPSDLVH